MACLLHQEGPLQRSGRAVLRVLAAVERGVDAVLQPVVFLGVVALIAVMTLQIVSRVFFTAAGWTEEAARFLLVWLTFLGAALAYQRGRHIAVTSLVEMLPAALQRVCRVAVSVVAIGFLLVLVVVGYRYMDLQSFQRSASLQVSMFYVYAVMPASAAIMAFYALVDLLEAMLGTSGGADAAGSARPEAPES